MRFRFDTPEYPLHLYVHSCDVEWIKRFPFGKADTIYRRIFDMYAYEGFRVTDATFGWPTSGDAEELAVFVDFENIRYSTINSYGREPDPLQWRDMAMEHGLMAVARAYADFDQHPEAIRTRLDVAGFEAFHYPAKRVTDASGRERYTSRRRSSVLLT